MSKQPDPPLVVSIEAPEAKGLQMIRDYSFMGCAEVCTTGDEHDADAFMNGERPIRTWKVDLAMSLHAPEHHVSGRLIGSASPGRVVPGACDRWPETHRHFWLRGVAR